MKPPPLVAKKFINALEKRGWRIQKDEIHSDSSYLHFPYPDGWLDTLDHLREIMERRLTRFKDLNQETHLEPEMREKLIKVHRQALEAIQEAAS